MEQSCVDSSESRRLISFDSKPNCTVLFNGGNTADLVAGETSTLKCTVSYSTNLSPLAAKWTDPQGQLVPGLPTGLPFDGNFYSYINITANKSNIQPYSIMIYFLPPDGTPSGAASNAPSYTYNWTSDVIPVLFPVDEISIAAGECSEGFASFTCQASSNPPPSYQWMDCCRGVISTDSTVQLQYQGIYTCVASNVIRGTTYQLLENITFYGCPQPSTLCSTSGVVTTALLTKVTEDNGDLHVSTKSSSNSNTTESSYDNNNNNNNDDTAVIIIILSVILGLSIISHIATVAAFVTYRKRMSTSTSSSEGKPGEKSVNPETSQIYQELNSTNSSSNGLEPAVTYEKLIPNTYQELNPITSSTTEPYIQLYEPLPRKVYEREITVEMF